MHREVISPYEVIVNIGANRTLAPFVGNRTKKGISMRLKTIDPE